MRVARKNILSLCEMNRAMYEAFFLFYFFSLLSNYECMHKQNFFGGCCCSKKGKRYKLQI